MEKQKLSEEEVEENANDANGNLAKKADSKDEQEEKNAASLPYSSIGIGTARRPPDITFKEKVKKFFFNPEEGSCFGRTPKSWALIILFFICFYTVLFSGWIMCWYVFLQTLEDPGHGSPKYQGSASIITNNPGVGVKPPIVARLDLDDNIKVKSNVRESMEKLQTRSNVRPVYKLTNGLDILEDENEVLADTIDDLFESYKTIHTNNSKYNTSFDAKSSLGDCAKWHYGYKDEIEPCFYLTLNKIWGFKPKEINATDFEKNEWPKVFKERWEKTSNKSKVFFHCDELETKRGSKKVEFTYFPDDGGMDLKYFPFLGSSDNGTYHQPIVAVKLKLPNNEKRTRNYLIECKAYYQDVIHSSKLGRLTGLIQFEVQVKEMKK